MTTIATIARVISAHAGVADVDRWAEALHAAEMLPDLDKPAGPAEAAMLLLAVLAAPTPDQAADAATTLRGARLAACQHGIDNDGAVAWQFTDATRFFPYYSPLDHLRDAIHNDGLSPVRFTRITVTEGGVSATLLAGGAIQGRWFGAQMTFRNNDAAAFPGIRRLVEIDVEPLIGALQEAFTTICRKPAIDRMPSTLQH